MPDNENFVQTSILLLQKRTNNWCDFAFEELEL